MAGNKYFQATLYVEPTLERVIKERADETGTTLNGYLRNLVYRDLKEHNKIRVRHITAEVLEPVFLPSPVAAGSVAVAEDDGEDDD